MKNLFLSLAAILVMTVTSNAQSIGATLGGNIATVSTSDVDNVSSKFNFTAGLFAEFMFNEKLALQPELVISGQGYKFDENDGSGLFILWKQKLTYVNIPVLINYYVADNFYLQGGPYLGILTNAEQNITGSLGILGGENKDEFNSTDFGAAIGVGLKTSNINIGFRYQVGLSNIAVDDRTIKNSVVNISVGYRFVEDE